VRRLIGVFGETDRPGLGDPFEPRSDIHAIAHQVAVALLDHIAQMDADAELDDAPVDCPLKGATVMRCDGRINEIAAEGA
jgi:hypothetical protein